MSDAAGLLIRLIRIAISGNDAEGSLDSIAESDWLGVSRLVRLHGLGPWLYIALKKNGGQARLPALAMKDLRGTYLTAVAKFAKREQVAKLALKSLAENGVVPVGLKGLALAHTVYPDPACRPMDDLDLWVTQDEMPRAQQALEAIGYVGYAKSARPPRLQMRNRGEVQMFATEPRRGMIELHWGVFPGEWASRTAHLDDDQVRARAVAVSVNGQRMLALSPEDGILQLSFHLAVSHQMSAPWLRALVDVALLARAQPVAWYQVVARARAWRVATATHLVLKLTWGLAGFEDRYVLESLAPSALRCWLLGKMVNLHSMASGRDLTRGSVRFFYLLLLVDRVIDAFRLLGRAVWPKTEWLEDRYGRAGCAIQLQHFVNALRGHV